MDRTTLHRFHEPILAAIGRVDETAPKENSGGAVRRPARQMPVSRNIMLSLSKPNLRLWALARINHRLQAHVEELEAGLRVRDERIAVLRRQVSTRSKCP